MSLNNSTHRSFRPGTWIALLIWSALLSPMYWVVIIFHSSQGAMDVALEYDNHASPELPSTPLRELSKLTNSGPVSCAESWLNVVNDTLFTSNEQKVDRKGHIPRIVHMTSKSRCMPVEFTSVMDQWRCKSSGVWSSNANPSSETVENYSFFFHDDVAVDRLVFGSEWPEFPHLQQALRCTRSGAGKADLWRALVLYKYGGIYSDIDNAPSPLFNHTTLEDSDEAFFVVERIGLLSQYFMAAKPKHPLFFMLVHHTLHRLLSVSDVDSQYVPFVTGPGALKSAFMEYMGVSPTGVKDGADKLATYQQVRSGVYRGLFNTSVTVVGNKNNANEFVRRDVVPNKSNIYRKMGMKHFSKAAEEPSRNESCFVRVYREMYHEEGGDSERL